MTFYRIFIFFALIFFFNVNSYSQQDKEQILNRHRSFLLDTDTIGKATVDSIIAGFDPSTKRWNSINYTDNTLAGWDTRNHLVNVKLLAAYWARTSKGQTHPSLLKIIIAALDEWYEHKFRNPNWWHNEVGVPQLMRDIVVLMLPSLSKNQLSNYLEIIRQYRLQGTGANRIWLSDIALFYGLLTDNKEIINTAVTSLINEVKISNREGLKPDYSFHQHDERLQMFQYGKAFLLDNIRLAWELQNSQWAYPANKVKLLSGMLLNGWQWMARGINTVPETMDRSCSRPGELRAADVRNYIKYFIALDPYNEPQYTKLHNNQEGRGYSLRGYKSYPYSDFSSHHNKNYSFFLKTISTRTLPAEHINFENLKGDLLNSGETYFIRTGNEYYNLMPVWHWDRLPGITSFEGAAKISRKNYCGSVSDGNIGFTSMEYKMIAKDTNIFFSCKKSWFVVDDLMICLLSDMQFSGIEKAYTILDQSRFSGTVNTDAGGLLSGDYKNSSYNWIFHNKFVYAPLLKNEVLSLYADTSSGNWYDINNSYSKTKITETIFMPYLNHTTKSYFSGYLVSFLNKKNSAKKLLRKPVFKVLSNNKNCQAVQLKNGVLMAAFYDKGNITFDGKFLNVNRPCMLLQYKGKFYIADPNHAGGSVNINYNNKNYEVVLANDGSTAILSL
ncbi:MAG: polysaccharide lyase family 8 super-sandwich domain-containing protein [Niabella sp.]